MAGRLAAGMAELNRRYRALFADEIVDPPERRNMLVLVDAGTQIGLAPAPLDRRFLAENDPRTAGGQPAQMHELPVGWTAIVRMVLAHGRDYNTVARRHAADGDRREQKGQRFFSILRHGLLYTITKRKAQNTCAFHR